MGLKYVAAESAEVMAALSENLATGLGVLEQLRHASEHLVATVGTGELSGKAYAAVGRKFQDGVLPETMRAVRWLESVHAELAVYRQADAVVNRFGVLFEDELEIQLASTRIRRDATEELMNVNAMVANSLVLVPWLSESLRMMNQRLAIVFTHLVEYARLLQHKLDALREFDATTRNLFQHQTLESYVLAVTAGKNTTATVADRLMRRILSGKLSEAEVAAVWAELVAQDGCDVDAFVRKHANALAALDGLPALVRVRANQYRAPGLVAQAEAELKKLKGSDKERADFLRHEITYLKRVGKGKIQLYLYDRERSRIIEMIGIPGPDTVRTVTYVPGTFTGMDSFFTGGVQEISKHLTDNAPGTVVFVYKDGLFPGESHRVSAGPNYARIVEANGLKPTLAAGKKLAGFATGMRADPFLGGTKQVAIGHSWGLANVTCSEQAGVRYDEVVSLAGAGMPPGWKPNAETSYSNLFYQDVLVQAQSLTGKIPFTEEGPVWGGNNPIYSDAFEQFYYPDDRINGKGINVLDEAAALLDNHDRITRDSNDNQKALDNIEWIVTR